MKKTAIYFLVLLTVCSLSLTLVPGAHSQSEIQNVKIVSYSYYIDTSGYLDVVGEVQNTGSNTVTAVVITGQVVSSDGTVQANSYTFTGIPPTIVQYLTPQQKAPFYLDFFTPSNSPDGTWMSVDISKINLAVAQANATANYGYSDLKVTSSQGSVGTISTGTTADKGVFWVNGKVQNTGSQTAQNITVYGTFYNSTGQVVAVGYSDQTTTNPQYSLSPSQTATFKLGAFDLNQTLVSPEEKISSYSLLIEVAAPILQGTAPVISATPTPGPITSTTSSSTSSPTSSQGSQTTPTNITGTASSTPQWIYAVVVVVAIVAVAAALLLIKKRKPK